MKSERPPAAGEAASPADLLEALGIDVAFHLMHQSPYSGRELTYSAVIAQEMMTSWLSLPHAAWLVGQREPSEVYQAGNHTSAELAASRFSVLPTGTRITILPVEGKTLTVYEAAKQAPDLAPAVAEATAAGVEFEVGRAGFGVAFTDANEPMLWDDNRLVRLTFSHTYTGSLPQQQRNFAVQVSLPDGLDQPVLFPPLNTVR